MIFFEEAQIRLEHYLAREVEIVQYQSVTWNNGSLGCPEPGHCYTQALVPGYDIHFRCGDEVFSVHTDSSCRTCVLATKPPVYLRAVPIEELIENPID